MRKLLKVVLYAGGLFVGLIILLLVAAAIIIPIKFPPEKLKSMASEKLTQTLKHKVSIGDVHFNVLSGFDIKDLVVSNRAGWAATPLVKAQDISISYHLFPLLWGEVSLGEIRLNQPQIFVERKGLNEFNFSDMMGPATAPAAPAPAAQTQPEKKSKPAKKHKKTAMLWIPQEVPVVSSFFADAAWADTTAPVVNAEKSSKSTMLLSVDSLNIIQGHLEYLDETVSPAQKTTADDLNVKIKNISMVGGKTTYSIDTPFTYNKMTYQLGLSGSVRYFMASQSIKDLDLNGKVNDLGFKLSGDASDMTGNFTPNLDGTGSLNMLKFSGLVPKNLSSMPSGLTLTGQAEVTYHLGGSVKNGLELSGTADGSDLAIQYQDLFVKTAKTTCKINFKSVVGQNSYDLPSFSLMYQDWEVDGSFHYKNGVPWTCVVRSKALPLKGISDMVPRLKKATFGGDASIDVTFTQSKGAATPFSYKGQVSLKDISITLPNEPYLDNLNSVIYLAGNSVKIPMAKFQCFEGTGMAGVTVNLGAVPNYTYAFRLDGVNSQKAIDASIDAYVTTKDYSAYKDKLFGTMNFAYAGYGKGTSGDVMMASQVGAGNYSLVDAKVKGLAAIKTINSAVKDSSDEIHLDKIEGTLGMKNKVFSYTANTVDKVGALRIKGGVNGDGVYTPDMTINCDIKKDYVNSDSVKGQIPEPYRDQFTLDWASDNDGNIPVDFKFTGKASENHYQWVSDRLVSNIKKRAGQALGNAAKNAVKQKAQDVGNKIKSLFGH